MRFAISIPSRSNERVTKRTGDWPLFLRVALFVLPVGFALVFLSLWMGYRSASVTLEQSLDALPLLESKVQAGKMEGVLDHLRNSLVRIAQLKEFTASQFRESLEQLLQHRVSLVEELGFRDVQGRGFLLLRNNGGFQTFTVAEASQGPHSPFQQINTVPSQPGQVSLCPAVFTPPSLHSTGEHAEQVLVIRMLLPLKDGSGVLVLGINVKTLQQILSASMQPDSPLRLPVQAGSLQLSYFFDVSGWMLFEMEGAGSRGFLPDSVRRGFGGDLGRSGFDAAFRPWDVHDGYWQMVAQVKESRSECVPVPVDHYYAAHAGQRAALCYAPVRFAPAEGMKAVPVGGIAYFETSSLPMAAFLRAANISFIVSLIAFVCFVGIVFYCGRYIGRPLRLMAEKIKAMNASGEYRSLDDIPSCSEHQKLQAAVNSVISRTMVLEADMERARHTGSRLPVDLSQILAKPRPVSEFGLVGSSPQIKRLREQVRKAARAGTDVLIWGETGTGKELAAEAIHNASPRVAGPFVSINCGALDENLLLDALFGHVKGAFSEAKMDRKGAFLAAEGGTLHLDEIATASAKVQQALLRVLSVRRISPLGSDKEISINTRVVAATNVDLRDCMREGTFREDLYYRLATITIEMPPLRTRKEDIPELAGFFLHEAATSLRRPEARLSRGALEVLAAHDWPGNVRELKNCLTRSMAFADGDLILHQHILLEQDPAYADPLTDPLASGREADANGASDGPLNSGKDLPDAQEAGARQSAGRVAEYFWPRPGKDQAAIPTSKDSVPRQEPEETKDSSAAGPFDRNGSEEKNGSAKPAEAQPGPDAQPARGGNGRSRNRQRLNERQLRAMQLIRSQGGITRVEYESIVGQDVSPRTAQNDLKELVRLGMLERVGQGPGTWYIFIGK